MDILFCAMGLPGALCSVWLIAGLGDALVKLVRS